MSQTVTPPERNGGCDKRNSSGHVGLLGPESHLGYGAVESTVGKPAVAR
jgi:hypothetical protein